MDKHTCKPDDYISACLECNRIARNYFVQRDFEHEIDGKDGYFQMCEVEKTERIKNQEYIESMKMDRERYK